MWAQMKCLGKVESQLYLQDKRFAVYVLFGFSLGSSHPLIEYREPLHTHLLTCFFCCSLKAAVAIMNEVAANKFPKLLQRVLEKLHLKVRYSYNRIVSSLASFQIFAMFLTAVMSRLLYELNIPFTQQDEKPFSREEEEALLGALDIDAEKLSLLLVVTSHVLCSLLLLCYRRQRTIELTPPNLIVGRHFRTLYHIYSRRQFTISLKHKCWLSS